MADVNTIATARARLVVAMELSLGDLASEFRMAASQLDDDSQDAERRAAYIFTGEGMKCWSRLDTSKANDLRRALSEFDRIVRESESAPAELKIYMDTQNGWQGPKEPEKYETGLTGYEAELVKYLKRAGFRLTVRPFGMYFTLVCAR